MSRFDRPWAAILRGQDLLARGEYAEGWRLWRDGRRRLPEALELPGPGWDGSDPAGRSLLAIGDLGLGDQVMFARFLPAAAAAFGGLVVAMPNDRLRAPIGRATAACLAPPEASLRRRMVVATFGELPALLGCRVDTVPPPLALAPPPGAAPRPVAAPAGTFRVGVAWSGPTRASREPAARSWPLAAARPLAGLPGVALVSLQRGEGSEQVASCGFDVATPAAADVDDTLALIAALDLVVTLDSLVAHLAASMGKPTWIATPAAEDWRWHKGADGRSPWYPAARTFRREEAGGWRGVFDRMAVELRRTLESPEGRARAARPA